jgi:arylsulfatase A-like enzyme/tetratricopeptide (TPR) repeat protein
LGQSGKNLAVKNLWLYLALVVLVVIVGAVWLLHRPGIWSGDVGNVILISIDTCRADYLSCYGYRRRTTPNIDRLAQESVLFTNAITPIPTTLPAHCSMLTGTIPPYHGVHFNVGYKLGQSNLTLAEILRPEGFTTAAFISAFVLDSDFGLNKGFDTYDDSFKQIRRNIFGSERKGGETSRIANEWMEKREKDEKFFLFLHYYDPHFEYQPPEPFASEFSDNLYAGEVAYTDYCIGLVIDKLKELGLYDSTLIIITADHGEMLGEHGESDHGYFIYEAAIKVPLVFKLPWRNEGRKVDDAVSITDIVPTVCGMVGADVPPAVRAKDLSAYFESRQPSREDRYLYCESMMPTRYNAGSLLGVVTDRFKYIQTARPELYDLVEDPDETSNLIEQQPHQARILQDRLKRILEQTVRTDASESVQLDEQAIGRLASLGYVGGDSVKEDYEFDQSREDPKDLIEFHTSFYRARRLLLAKKYDKAKSIYEQLLLERPQFYELHFDLANIAVKANDLVAAAAYLGEAIRLEPGRYELHHNLGMTSMSLGRFEQAAKHFRDALKIKSAEPAAMVGLGLALLSQGRFDEAVIHYTRALEIAPDIPELHGKLGLALYQQGKIDDAIRHYTKALEIEPRLFEVQNNLGMALLELGRLDEAIACFKKALAINPQTAQAHHNLARVFAHQGRLDEAIEHFNEALRIRPDSVELRKGLEEVLAQKRKNEK